MKGLILLAIAASIAGCSSSKPQTNSAVSNSSSSASRPDNSAAAVPATEGSPPTGGPLVEPGQATAVATAPNKKKLVDSGEPPPAPTRIGAAENSEVATTMNSAGNFVETRWFKNHPQLLQVERTWQNDGKSTLKITLRDGRVVSASGDSVKQMPAHPSGAFLELAGIKTAPVPSGDTGAK